MQTSQINIALTVEHSLSAGALEAAVSEATQLAVSGLLMATEQGGGYVRGISVAPVAGAPEPAPAGDDSTG